MKYYLVSVTKMNTGNINSIIPFAFYNRLTTNKETAQQLFVFNVNNYRYGAKKIKRFLSWNDIAINNKKVNYVEYDDKLGTIFRIQKIETDAKTLYIYNEIKRLVDDVNNQTYELQDTIVVYNFKKAKNLLKKAASKYLELAQKDKDNNDDTSMDYILDRGYINKYGITAKYQKFDLNKVEESVNKN